MKNKLLPVLLSLIVFLSSYLLSRVFYGGLDSNFISTLLGMSSFIFGVFFAYYLGISNTKFTKITEALRKDDKTILSIYYNSLLLSNRDHQKIKSLIDNYLINQIDYYLRDYGKTGKKFFELQKYCQSIDPKGYKQENAYENIQDLLMESLENRKTVESQLTYRVSNIEWIALSIFAFSILVCMFLLSTGGILVSLLIAVISMGILIILYLLYDLDSLQWKSSELIWTPLAKLFTDMNLLPYYPKKVFMNLSKGNTKSKVRLVEYTNAYPNFDKKKIEEVEV